jgi:ribulose-phosphate 3-epimerase
MSKQAIQIEPSLLSADFGALAAEAKRTAAAGADALHLDIMDGHFVPNLTFGPTAVAAVNRATDLFLDVHLMIYNPYDYIESFVKAGADRIIIHFEATEHVEDTLDFIRRCNVQAGLAFRPETSGSLIPKFLPFADLILVMTVSPGFGGQEFMPKMLDKVKLTREAADRLNLNTLIQVDGGINDKTAKLCVAAGANVLVSGSYLYSQPDLKEAIEKLRHVK